MYEVVHRAAFSFPYVKEHGGIPRPKIPIIISVGGLRSEVAGLIDSGSDYVLFPKAIAEAIGIKLTGRTEEADGVGGKIECKSGIATIILRKGKNSKILTNMRIHVQTKTDTGIDEILLGRNPFFKYFIIEFNENANRVRLTPIRRPLKSSYD